MIDDEREPPRLVDAEGGAPDGLRQLMGAAREDVGSAEQVARVAKKLGVLLVAPAAVSAGAASGLSTSAKLGISTLALIVAGGGAWLLSTSRSAPPSAPAPVTAPPAPPSERVAPPEQALPPPSEASAPAEPAAPGDAAPSGEPVAPPAAPGPRHSPSEKPQKASAPAQVSEAELLEQARRALGGNPALALAKANEHRQRFPGGVLVQEREVIAIKALRALGRSAEAQSRAAAFERAFPGSAFQRKLKPSP